MHIFQIHDIKKIKSDLSEEKKLFLGFQIKEPKFRGIK
jgi:hypothetical protein